jgi:hypothetical protein
MEVALQSPEGKRDRKKVAVCVLLAHKGPRPTPKHEARHLDGNRMNDTLGNLDWGTHAENEHDKVLHGTVPKGTNHRSSKVNPQIAEAIRERAAGGDAYPAIAADYGLSLRTVGRIVRREARA